jgi:CelD/BcsL family acetyltransferase involved in cellulose biosynthesis
MFSHTVTDEAETRGEAVDAAGRPRLELFGAPADLRADWSELAAASRNPFATVEWAEAWLEHASGSVRSRLFAAAGPTGRIAAIVPLVIVRGRYVRKVRFLGFGAANELGPICAREDRELGVEALRLALAATRDEWDVFLGESLPADDWPARLGATLVARSGSPVVRGPWESWDHYLASRSRSLRKELRQKERRLRDRGLRYRTVTDPADLDEGLDRLFELHRARWGAEASPWFAGLERFHRAFARAALRRGWLRLRLLELAGRVAAANHSFRFGDIEWSYQHGRDPDLERESVGLLIFGHAVREAFGEHASEFRLGPGTQEYKLRFATDDPGLETVALARGLRGRASVRATRRRGG